MLLGRHGETDWNAERRLQVVSYGMLEERHSEYSLCQVGPAALDARPEGAESLADLRDRVLDA